MRKRTLIILFISSLLCGQVYAQSTEEKAAPPDSTAVEVFTMPDYPIMDYSKPSPYIINNIEVKGIKYLNTDLLIATSGLSKGQTIYLPGSAISQATNRLWNQRYFSDVNIVAEPRGDSVNLEIYLQERPRVYRWEFEGIRKGQATTLMDDHLKLKRGTELSDYVINKNIHLIKKFFREKGFLNTEVTPRIENDSVIQNVVNVTFVINRNEKVRIGEITFAGNEQFPDKRLRRTMKKTNQVSLLFYKSFKLNDEEFENDKDNLIDFYNSQGYRNAAILSDSVYVMNEKRVGIHIKLDEGNKYYIRNVSWTGNTEYPTEFLERVFAVKKGDVYDKKTIDKRLGIGKEENPEDPTQVKSMYQNQGYLFSMVDPTEVVIGTDSIDVNIKIFEGRPFTINNVNISGNMKVNDEVIRREIYTRPGELYNRALIMQTLRQLAQMQHFDPAQISPMPTPISNELVDISWNLAETPSDKFEISGGWGQGMFVGSVGIHLTNVDMGSVFKKGAWRPYPHGKNQQLSIRGQTNGSYYSSISGSFTEPWLGGKKPNSLTVSAYYSSQTNSYNWYGIVQKATKYFRTTGVSVGLGRRLKWPDQYFTLYNELGYQHYNLTDWGNDSGSSSGTQTDFMFQDGRSNILTFRTVLARSTVNQPIYPSSGSEFSLSLTFTPPYSLFDGHDHNTISSEISAYESSYGRSMANTAAPESEKNKYRDNIKKQYGFIEYHKWLAKMTWYFPLTYDQKLVLMARAEMGYLGHYNQYKVSPFEGFSVGGDGMTGYSLYGVDYISLRGYEDDSLTPVTDKKNSDFAKVYNKYTVELRYPIIMQPQSTIWVLGFAEAGNAYSSWKQFDPFTLKRSLGAGVRLYLPVVGMIGVDWGYGFDAPAGSTKRHGGQIHFMMGTTF